MEVAFIPNFLIKSFSDNFIRQNDYNIFLSNLIILLFFFFTGNQLVQALDFLPHFCLIDKLTGIECPVCGTIRAFCELSMGNIGNAYRFNRTSVLVMLFFIIQLPFRIFSLTGIVNSSLINKISYIASKLILGLIIFNWIYKILINNQ